MTSADWLALVRSRHFWGKAEKTAGGCWLWTAAKDKDGFGKYQIGNRHGRRPKQKHVRAARVAYELTHGPIPEGLYAIHWCQSRACVNPAHLWAGTQAEGRAYAAKVGRVARGERNGAHTHPEKRQRGESHWARRRPERVPRGLRWQKARASTWAPNLKALHDEQRPGMCAACDEPLPVGRSLICHAVECRRIHNGACRADRAFRAARAALKSMTRAQRRRLAP